jgi:ribitol 2-dehydrogenase
MTGGSDATLTGRVALVTGASSGIGRALARALARHGVVLALAGRSAERLAEARAELGGAEALVLPGDMARPADVEDTVRATLARFGRIDILCANAGIYVPGEVAEGDPDLWDRMIATNVNAVFRIVHAVLPGMIARRSGDILVTSSIAGHQAFREEPAYSGTKHAVQAFVHGLRRQVAPYGIRVGAVAPGTVLNPLWGFHDEAAIAAKVAAREGLRSEDVADAMLFVLTRPPHVTIRDLVILPQNEDL